MKREERIEALRKRQAQIQAQLKDLEAQKRKVDGAKARKDDNRRKLLHGIALQAAIRAGQVSQARVDEWCHAFLSQTDRDFLFPSVPTQVLPDAGSDT